MKEEKDGQLRLDLDGKKPAQDRASSAIGSASTSGDIHVLVSRSQREFGRQVEMRLRQTGVFRVR